MLCVIYLLYDDVVVVIYLLLLLMMMLGAIDWRREGIRYRRNEVHIGTTIFILCYDVLLLQPGLFLCYELV